MNQEKKNSLDIQHYLKELKTKNNIKAYTPLKYFTGLKTKKQIKSRFFDIVKGKDSDFRDPSSYKKFATDQGVETKKSKYTLAFEKIYGSRAKSLRAKSEASGVPLEIIDEVFRKGKAAWRTGHRVGANEDQWGYARVHSFLTLGCTALGPDFYLLKRAISLMHPKDVKKWLTSPILCPKETLDKKFFTKFGAKQFIEKKKNIL